MHTTGEYKYKQKLSKEAKFNVFHTIVLIYDITQSQSAHIPAREHVFVKFTSKNIRTSDVTVSQQIM